MFLFILITLNAQTIPENHERWDHIMIRESAIWKNILVNYNCIDITSCWEERQKALNRVIKEFSTSQWVDDAMLMLICEKAIVDNSIDKAILELKELQKKYPTESTIVDGWHFQRGCQINETWLMWAPSLVVHDYDGNIKKTFPYDRDSIIDNLELETLTYFDHLDRYPQKTTDIAEYIIVLMYLKLGETDSAIKELENFLSKKDFREIRTTDFEASKKPTGGFIESTPPFDVAPLWRVELASCQLLINLYSKQKQIDKLIEVSNKIVTEYSPDGWYWQINKDLGDIYAKHKYLKEANEQYNLSINGIKKRSKIQAARIQQLYEKGLAIKSKNFANWEDEALKAYKSSIIEIENLKRNLNE